ncbi:hypothetical protein HK105_204782 [Polyrhizophydium stewartii]|uniref:Dienelactone hydrolase domain-containing protein n=1 Tax=Polyrhizophydium stewartii TaxID=2732419 RepID=A0ABR4N7V3_9FUNG
MTTDGELGPCCVEGFLWKGTPLGREIRLGELDAYVAEPRLIKRQDTAILFLHDVFGWKVDNPRLVADRMAALAGAPVYLVDFYNGIELGTPGNLKYPLMEFVGMFPVDATTERINKVLDALRAQGKTRFGAVGYCWGGKYSLRLGDGTALAVVACHPSLVNVETDIAPITSPTLFLLAETDSIFTPDLKAKTMEQLEKSGVKHSAKEYKGTTHGFAIRCEEVKEQLDARDDACAQAAAWFDKHLN